MVKNLAQFKKYIEAGKCFEIVEQFVKPENVGQIRKPTKVQTNAFYSKCINEHPLADNVNGWNGGLGSFFEYEKASQWSFEGNLARFVFKNGNPLWTIRLIEA